MNEKLASMEVGLIDYLESTNYVIVFSLDVKT